MSEQARPDRSASTQTATLRATLGGGPGAGATQLTSLAATLAGPGAVGIGSIDLDETQLGVGGETGASAAASAPRTTDGTVSTARTTVLPRRKPTAAQPAAGARARFERVRTLGEGAMGEVALMRDNDIRRTVAVKRLHHELSSEAALLRFADEVRIVGQLEHPSIVPIYDVGRDEDGKIYLVMKHLQGQTMEQIIEGLAAGDATLRARFTISARVHMFLAVLDAVRYAHSRGVVHRDLKPANIMIGPFGEVTVLDWGIAKPIRRDGAAPAKVGALDRTSTDSHDGRLLETSHGALAGTPLYMSPEQAAGRNDEIDERSDVYALCMVLHEWLVLQHPLAEKKTLQEVLAFIIARDYTLSGLRPAVLAAGVPIEYLHIILEGLERDPAARLQSVAQLEQRIQDVLAGRVRIKCHVTLAKRIAHNVIAWIDSHPGTYSVLFGATLLGVLAGAVAGVVHLIR